jgi:hypothetical protein
MRLCQTNAKIARTQAPVAPAVETPAPHVQQLAGVVVEDTHDGIGGPIAVPGCEIELRSIAIVEPLSASTRREFMC